MDEGRVIFQVTKVGTAVNNSWKVFVDGKYAGKIDFEKDLELKLSKGKHNVQYKVGFQSTKVLEIEVADDDVIVECVFDGTVNNFHVVGGALEETSEENDNIDIKKLETSEEISAQDNTPKKDNNWISFLIIGIIAVAYFFVTIFSGESNETGTSGEQGSSDFGITATEFIKNVKAAGVTITEGQKSNLEDGGVAYEYKNGDRLILVYTNSNGKVTTVSFNDNGINYGMGFVSEATIKLAAKVFAGLKINESQQTLYSAIYGCVECESGTTVNLDNCIIGYSKTVLEYYETVWISAE